SRTFPINGTFTKRQKEIYSVVLAANKYIMSLVKPGITLRELNNKLIAFYEGECKKIGLLKHGKTIDDYYWHGVSHMLGLETHDVSLSNYELEEGNVFTIEPGLYIEAEAIGIRIEDNVLVTKDGCINLSADIIKEVSEIEAFMAKHK
ncbi:MAG: M24 family metallopeptidase, partial [Longicatena sp.]